MADDCIFLKHDEKVTFAMFNMNEVSFEPKSELDSNCQDRLKATGAGTGTQFSNFVITNSLDQDTVPLSFRNWSIKGKRKSNRI